MEFSYFIGKDERVKWILQLITRDKENALSFFWHNLFHFLCICLSLTIVLRTSLDVPSTVELFVLRQSRGLMPVAKREYQNF